MPKVIKHTHRYVVQWKSELGWFDEKSFRYAWAARKYARAQPKWMPYDYRVIDTEATDGR